MLSVHEIDRSSRKPKISENVIMFYKYCRKNQHYVAFAYVRPHFIVSLDEFRKFGYDFVTDNSRDTLTTY